MYVGPVSDPGITDRVMRFSRLKAGFKRRQTLVRALIAAGLPTPDPLSGRIVEAAKSVKDFQQAQMLIEVLSVRRPAVLADSWSTAWAAGEQWRRKLESGKARLPSDAQTMLSSVSGKEKHPRLRQTYSRATVPLFMALRSLPPTARPPAGKSPS